MLTARRWTGFVTGAFLLPVLLFLAHLTLPASARDVVATLATGVYVPARALAAALSPAAGALDGTRLMSLLGAQTLLMGLLAAGAYDLARHKLRQRRAAAAVAVPPAGAAS